jgi:hypothetical protein
MLFLISCVIKFGLFPSQTNFIAIVDTQHVERPSARTGSLPPHLLDHGDQGHGSDQEADDGHSSSVPCDIWKLFFPNLAYCLGNCLSTTNTM